MSSGESVLAMPSITGFLRSPDLKFASCFAIYSACWPARIGLAGVALLPSLAWQAEQTLETI